MSLHMWLGGVELSESGALTAQSEIRSLLPLRELVYPLWENGQMLSSAIVREGEYVRVGQMIAGAKNINGAFLFSSVSGHVTAIEERPAGNGGQVLSIVIENDENYTEITYPTPIQISQLSQKDMISMLFKSGVTDSCQKRRSLFTRLLAVPFHKITCIILNALEDALLTGMYRRMMEDSEQILKGAKVLEMVYPRAKIIFAVAQNQTDAITELRKRTKAEPSMEVAAVSGRYPSMEESILVYQITGRRLNSTISLEQEGILILQTDTLCAMAQAVYERVPVMSRVVTLSGDAFHYPGNYEALLGTKLSDLLKRAGGFKSTAGLCIKGGAMKGTPVSDLDIPITQKTEGFLFFEKDRTKDNSSVSCIHCGKCMEACPNRLVPEKLMNYALKHQLKTFQKWHGMECLSCGCCTYVCPVNLKVSECIRAGKKEVIKGE